VERTEAVGLERAIRQRLANKVNGNLIGLWLLLPEHLRLGTWDLLRSWTGPSTADLHARLALQLVHESVLCVSGLRAQRTLSQRGFELLNGLPYVATDVAIHQLLDAHTVAQALRLQIALGKIRHTFGHFLGQRLILDPHRLPSHSQRQMLRLRKDPRQPPAKMAQTFFCLDADTAQPLGFTSASAARSVSCASPELLRMAEAILAPLRHRPLVLADSEHHTVELFRSLRQGPFDLLVPKPMHPADFAALRALAPTAFQPRWPGYATLHRPFHFAADPSATYHQVMQRTGERPGDWQFKTFLCSALRPEVQALSEDYPQRWHIEQFFDDAQALGWKHAGTLNLHIRYGRMTLALCAQAAAFMLRQRLPSPLRSWDASHFAKDFFRAVEGDLRVHHDPLLVTLYNCPHAESLKHTYENLPQKLSAEGISPAIPWLYNFKLDFRFR
jgi:hypothetical protein